MSLVNKNTSNLNCYIDDIEDVKEENEEQSEFQQSKIWENKSDKT